MKIMLNTHRSNLATAKGTLTLIEPAGEQRETEIIEVEQKQKGNSK